MKKENSLFRSNPGFHRKESNILKEDNLNLDNFASFNSLIANNIDENVIHEKKFGFFDWIIYEMEDDGKDDFSNLVFEQVIKRNVTLNSGKNLKIDGNLNQIIEV